MRTLGGIRAALAVVAVAAAMGVTAPAGSYRAESVTILQGAGDGVIPGQYHLPSTLETTTWGRLPTPATPPALRVPSGSTVTIDTLSHEGILEDQGRDPVAYFGRHGVAASAVLEEAIRIAASDRVHDFDGDGPHVVTGPVYVEGAMPGDVLKVEVLALEPRVPYGVITNRHYKGALPGEFPEGTVRHDDASPLQPDRYGNVSVFAPIKKIGERWYGYLETNGGEITYPLYPFLGIMGVVPDSPEAWNSIPPARIGGNLDINELGVGSTLYLPVEVEGALFYTGDPHFAQGDGEVALTALEGSLRGTVRLTVLKQGSPEVPKTNADNLVTPFAETEKFWIPIGLDEDLDEAMKMSVRESISFLAKQLDMDRHLIYAYLSAAVDYEVSQVVDKTKGIHALIPKVDFAQFITICLEAGGHTMAVSIVNDTLYVPLAGISQALGLACTGSGDSFTLATPAGTVAMRLDSNAYIVNGRKIYLEVSPLEHDGEVLLPAYSLLDLMGIPVTWSTVGTIIIGRAVPMP